VANVGLVLPAIAADGAFTVVAGAVQHDHQRRAGRDV